MTLTSFYQIGVRWLGKDRMDQIFLWAFAFFKVPLLGYVRARIIQNNEEGVVVMIPLGRRTQNHLHSMYFGALAVGADLAGGLAAVQLIYLAGAPVHFVFKDCRGEFLKRAEGDAYFHFTDVAKVQEGVKEAIATGKRISIPLDIVVTVPSKLGEEPVAHFTLTLSLKKSRGSDD